MRIAASALPRTASVLVGVLLVAMGEAPAARAAPSCAYDAAARTVAVQFAAPETVGVVTDSDGYIRVAGLRCEGATVSNTETVDITGSGGDDTADLKLSGGDFPGIVFRVGLGAGADRVRIFGGSGQDHVVVGADGVNLAADAASAVDVTMTGVESILVNGDPGPDTLSGHGGYGTGDPTDVRLVLFGGGGTDVLTGGVAGDLIAGNDNGDTLLGKAGPDLLMGNKGGDDLNGGAGTDRCLGGRGTDTRVNCP